MGGERRTRGAEATAPCQVSWIVPQRLWRQSGSQLRAAEFCAHQASAKGLPGVWIPRYPSALMQVKQAPVACAVGPKGHMQGGDICLQPWPHPALSTLHVRSCLWLQVVLVMTSGRRELMGGSGRLRLQWRHTSSWDLCCGQPSAAPVAGHTN